MAFDCRVEFVCCLFAIVVRCVCVVCYDFGYGTAYFYREELACYLLFGDDEQWIAVRVSLDYVVFEGVDFCVVRFYVEEDVSRYEEVEDCRVELCSVSCSFD